MINSSNRAVSCESVPAAMLLTIQQASCSTEAFVDGSCKRRRRNGNTPLSSTNCVTACDEAAKFPRVRNAGVTTACDSCASSGTRRGTTPEAATAAMSSSGPSARYESAHAESIRVFSSSNSRSRVASRGNAGRVASKLGFGRPRHKFEIVHTMIWRTVLLLRTLSSIAVMDSMTPWSSRLSRMLRSVSPARFPIAHET